MAKKEEENAVNTEKKVMLALTAASLGALIVFSILFAVGNALDIDTCTTFSLYNTSYNSSDNTSTPSYSLQICPKAANITQLNFSNLDWGYQNSGISGNCNYTISVKNSSDLFPKRNYTFSLPSNGAYHFEDSFLLMDIKADLFYCPICPVQKTCNVTYEFPGFGNQSQTFIQSDDECSVNVTMPAKPYCVTDEPGWFLNNTCIDKRAYYDTMEKAGQFDQCNATLSLQKSTWTAPSNYCGIAPKTLADGWKQLDSDQKNYATYFAAMSGGMITADDFAAKVSETARNDEERTALQMKARFALEQYRLRGFAEYWTENGTDSYGHPKTMIMGYKSLLTPACVNQSASLLQFGNEQYGSGRVKGIIISAIAAVLLIGALLTWLDTNSVS